MEKEVGEVSQEQCGQMHGGMEKRGMACVGLNKEFRLGSRVAKLMEIEVGLHSG